MPAGSPDHGPETGAFSEGPRTLTMAESFEKTSVFPASAKIGFGTGARPSLMNATGGPGPGAYPIKTTLGRLIESNFKSPTQFSLRSRQKFGDPNERTMSKTAALEPGPGQHDITGKFIGGTNPRKSGFPKGLLRGKEPVKLGPGPGSYEPLQSMGKQALSTKPGAMITGFPKAPRPSMVPPGSTTVGPGEYGPPSGACEPQVDSRRPTCGSIKIGIGYRKESSKSSKLDLREPSPGPGSYTLPGGVATKAKGSPYRDSPQATISGRNKFGSPW